MSERIEPTRRDRGGEDRSHLLRIRVQRDGGRSLIQDLEAGERGLFSAQQKKVDRVRPRFASASR
jgi:hypothetical protein